jgi:hypothetical protein
MFSTDDVLKALSRHIVQGNGARADTLVMEITGQPSGPVAERSLRDRIVELRMAGHHVCAHPRDGYFIAESEAELNDTCVFLYERAMTSLTQVSRMKNTSLPDLRGQLRLPT